jgi:hypothetical protein
MKRQFLPAHGNRPSEREKVLLNGLNKRNGLRPLGVEGN